MSHASMLALAAVTAVIAAVVLMFVSQHAHEHAGARVLVLIGAPVLLLLIFVIGTWRGHRA
jgi:ABC-type siderophore export system fused ATPase/permease subunit